MYPFGYNQLLQRFTPINLITICVSGVFVLLNVCFRKTCDGEESSQCNTLLSSLFTLQ